MGLICDDCGETKHLAGASKSYRHVLVIVVVTAAEGGTTLEESRSGREGLPVSSQPEGQGTC